MKNYLLALFILTFSTIMLQAQVEDQNQMNLKLDYNLEELESFLDSFSLSSITSMLMSPEFQDALPSDMEMEQIKDELRLGLDRLGEIDMQIFEDFINQLNNSLPNLNNLSPSVPVETEKNTGLKKKKI